MDDLWMYNAPLLLQQNLLMGSPVYRYHLSNVTTINLTQLYYLSLILLIYRDHLHSETTFLEPSMATLNMFYCIWKCHNVSWLHSNENTLICSSDMHTMYSISTPNAYVTTSLTFYCGTKGMVEHKRGI